MRCSLFLPSSPPPVFPSRNPCVHIYMHMYIQARLVCMYIYIYTYICIHIYTQCLYVGNSILSVAIQRAVVSVNRTERQRLRNCVLLHPDPPAPLPHLYFYLSESSVPACQSIVKKAVIAKLLSADPSRNFRQDSQGWLQVISFFIFFFFPFLL